MTHMHIPDGVLPVWLWVLGFIIMSLVMALTISRIRSMDLRKNIPLLGAMAAAMLVAMSIPVIPGYHVNLSVVTGILIGPSLGFAAAFITNIILALMGHGGITVIGLNTLLLGAESVLGHLFFTAFNRLPVFWRAAAATVTTLFITASMLVAIVAVSHVNPEVLHAGEDHGHGLLGEPDMGRFALVVFSIGSIGWLIEGAITGAVIKFISQVKPDLLGHGLHRKPRA
jgi:cobalt/nickel transport system permease protein